MNPHLSFAAFAWRSLLAAIALSALVVVSACGSPAPPATASCSALKPCTDGSDCVNGVCVPVNDVGPITGADTGSDAAGEASDAASPDGASEGDGGDGAEVSNDATGDADGAVAGDAAPLDTPDNPDTKTACEPGVTADCDDQNPCTDDVCDHKASGADAEGCTHVANDAATCDADGLSCTLDACKSGVCQPQKVLEAWCLVDGAEAGKKVCVADAQKDASGCRFCDATKSQNALQSVGKGASCGDLKGKCVLPECDGGGTCVDVEHVEMCDTGGACKTAVCGDGGLCSANLATSGTPCDGDGATCTLEVCDTLGACVPDGIDGATCKDASTCTEDACNPTLAGADATTGCVHAQKDAACDDGNPCTADACTPAAEGADPTTGCVHPSAPDKTPCTNDGIACTTDACLAGQCAHAIDKEFCLIDDTCVAANTLKSGEACSACKPSGDATGWTALDQVPCDDDQRTCTSDVCVMGACKHLLDAKSCLIAGVCYDEKTKDAGQCASCNPGAQSDAWTPIAAATPCPDDNVACTSDACDGKGACAHTPVHSACDDSLGCTQDACDPTKGADSKGCTHTDSCAFGHACDATAKACLTPNPITLVAADSANPAPTNPAVIRHVIDATKGTSRTWVVFQSQSCATASGGTWKIGGETALRAVVLDNDVAAPADKQKTPTIITLPVAKDSPGLKCQAYPVVVADPLSSTQAWLGWFETSAECALKGDAVGGIARLALLDGSAVNSGEVWAKAAGDVCTSPSGATGSLFETQGLALLDASGGDVGDLGKRGVLSMRAAGDGFASASSTWAYWKGTSATAASNAIGVAAPVAFSAVHPILVDTAKSGNRYFALALTEVTKTSTTTRTLWMQAFDATGTDAEVTTLISSTTPGPDLKLLNNVTAVCSLDGAFDAKGGDIGLAIVVRRKNGANTEGALLQVKVTPAATPTAVVTQVDVDASATGDCRKGLSSARIAVDAAGVWTVLAAKPASEGDPGTPKLYRLDGAGSVKATALDAISAQWTSDSDMSSNVPALAWRGLGDVVLGSDGAVSVAIEGKASGKHILLLHTFKPL